LLSDRFGPRFQQPASNRRKRPSVRRTADIRRKRVRISQGDRRAAVQVRRFPNFRQDQQRIREYDCHGGHAVQIEPGLRPRSPENGNISNIRRRLSAISLPQRPIWEPGDRWPIRKSPLLAGISEVTEGKVSRRRTAWLGREDSNLRMTIASLDRDPTSNNLAQNRLAFGPEQSVAVVTWGGLGLLRDPALPGALPGRG
jgi:hypothetical protein